MSEKNRLQEFCQKKKFEIPKYSVEEEGPSHLKRYKGIVIFNGNKFFAK